jgi:hypothetical protein
MSSSSFSLSDRVRSRIETGGSGLLELIHGLLIGLDRLLARPGPSPVGR